jgi:bifunctional DNase/RNase
MSRPLTHDLLKNVFGAFNARIIRIEIVQLQNDIFYGNIVADVDGREVHIDSRPSDAIALSVRAHVPILVHQSVMDEAGILPDADISESEDSPEKSPPVPLSKEGTERLSVFEDFLGKLDIDNLEDKDKPDDDKPDKPDKPKKPKKK